MFREDVASVADTILCRQRACMASATGGNAGIALHHLDKRGPARDLHDDPDGDA